MMNRIRGCECAPKYEVAQTWRDGRIRCVRDAVYLPTSCLIQMGRTECKLMRTCQIGQKISAKKMRTGDQDIKEKNERAGCEFCGMARPTRFTGTT